MWNTQRRERELLSSRHFQKKENVIVSRPLFQMLCIYAGNAVSMSRCMNSMRYPELELDGEVIYGRCWLDRRTAALHTKLVLVLETELER